MKFCFVSPQRIPRPKSEISISLRVVFDVAQDVFGPESFVAEVAGDDDSFDMVCLNVIFYLCRKSLLSTHFAQIS